MGLDNSVIDFFNPLSDKPIIIHSDLFNANFLVKPTETNRLLLLEKHCQFLNQICKTSHLWFPLFNYDFPKTKQFSPANSRAQLGPLPEYFRQKHAKWRTHTPIFSFGGNSLESLKLLSKSTLFKQTTNSLIDPFGVGSVFDILVENDGYILFYGAQLSSCTFIHYIERIHQGGPLYRFDKFFKGQIIKENNQGTDVTLKYHVRPLDKNIDYQWNKMSHELVQLGLLRQLTSDTRVTAQYISARNLKNYWINQLQHDPLSLLNDESRFWIDPMLQKLGRRFIISDFEKE